MSQLPLIPDCAPQPREVTGGSLAAPTGDAAAVRTGRKSKHESAAARVKACRVQYGRIDVLIPIERKAVIESIADNLDCSASALINNLICFALTNRNWRQLGLMGGAK